MPVDEQSPLQKAIREAVEASDRTRDSFDSELRKLLGSSSKPLWDVERGKVKKPSPRILRAMEQVLGFDEDRLVDLVHPRAPSGTKVITAGHGNTSPEQPATRSVDGGETAPILRLDLSYSMGPGTSLDDSYIESEAFEFDLGFLRTMTITPAERIRIVDGIGDSMQPTIHDRDLLFIDTNQRDLNAQDRIWALWLFGLGAVKRLRAIGPDRVLIMSDNPDVENQEVNRKDILIHGRVVGSIKRI